MFRRAVLAGLPLKLLHVVSNRVCSGNVKEERARQARRA
jgi:hypothetical protein